MSRAGARTVPVGDVLRRPSELPRVGGLVACDTETTGRHPDPPDGARVTVVSVAYRNEQGDVEAHAFPFEWGPALEDQMVLGFDEDPNLPWEEWEALLDWLSQQRLAMHPAKFDLTMLAAGTPSWEGMNLVEALEWDTMLAARDLDPEAGAGLDDVEIRIGPNGLLSTGERSDWLQSKKNRKRVNQMEWSEAARYAAQDAFVTLHGAEHQKQRYREGEGSWKALSIELNHTRVLFGMELRGIAYDGNNSMRIAANIKRWEQGIAQELPFRDTVHKAKAYFFGKRKYGGLELEPERLTPKGAPVLDEQEVAKLEASDVPHAREWALLSRLRHARTSWYEPYAQMSGYDGRLRTVYSQAKVISGRQSSTRVNLQAIPHDYQLPEIAAKWPTPRQLFQPREGTRLWELDLSQAELRVAAVEARCDSMLEMIANGEDIHGNVAMQLFDDEPGSPTWFQNRQIGKRCDFGLIFGLGPETFQKDLAKHTYIWRPINEINSIVRRWRGLFPEYGRAIRVYMDRANHWGYVRLVNGRVRFFAGYEDKHKAFNQYVQGSLAELMKQWMWEVNLIWPDVLLLAIHDSLVLEVPEGEEDLVFQAQDIGTGIGTDMFGVPMEVDVKEWTSWRSHEEAISLQRHYV